MCFVASGVYVHTSVALYILQGPLHTSPISPHHYLVRQVLLLSCLFDKERNRPRELKWLVPSETLRLTYLMRVVRNSPGVFLGVVFQIRLLSRCILFLCLWLKVTVPFEWWGYLWVTNLIFVGVLFLLLGCSFVFLKSNNDFCVHSPVCTPLPY